MVIKAEFGGFFPHHLYVAGAPHDALFLVVVGRVVVIDGRLAAAFQDGGVSLFLKEHDGRQQGEDEDIAEEGAARDEFGYLAHDHIRGDEVDRQTHGDEYRGGGGDGGSGAIDGVSDRALGAAALCLFLAQFRGEENGIVHRRA